MMRLRCSLLLLVIATLSVGVQAQMGAKRAGPSGITGNDGGELVQDANGNSAVRYSVAHPTGLVAEHGTLTISRERIKFEATNGRGFDHARSDMTVAKEWTNMFGASAFMAELKFNDNTVWHFTNEGSQIRAAGLFSPRITNYMALVNAANSPDSVIVPLEAIAESRNQFARQR